MRLQPVRGVCGHAAGGGGEHTGSDGQRDQVGGGPGPGLVSGRPRLHAKPPLSPGPVGWPKVTHTSCPSMGRPERAPRRSAWTSFLQWALWGRVPRRTCTD